jgi:hypothetical protein
MTQRLTLATLLVIVSLFFAACGGAHESASAEGRTAATSQPASQPATSQPTSQPSR